MKAVNPSTDKPIAVLRQEPEKIAKLTVKDESKLFVNRLVDKLKDELMEMTKGDGESIESAKGRPKSYTCREIAIMGIEYFRDCLKYNQPFTRSGLKVYLGSGNSASTEIQGVIDKLIGMVEVYGEMALHNRQNPIGAIFLLKNLGWSDNIGLQIKAPVMTEEEREQARKRMLSFSE